MRTAHLPAITVATLCSLASLGTAPAALADCDDYGNRIHAIGGYARFGGLVRDIELFPSGGSTYALLGIEGAAEEVVDVSVSDDANAVAGFNGGGGFRLALSGSTLVTTRGATGVGVYDVSSPASPVFRGNAALTQSAYDVSTTATYAYAVGDAGGFYTVRLTGGGSPALAGELYVGGSTARVAHYGNYAYVAHALGVTVVDVSNPASPSIVRRLSTNAKDVAVDGDRLYAAFGANVTIYSLTTPSFPSVLSSTLLTGTTTVDASGSRMIVGASGSTRLYDVTVPSAPVLLAATSAFDTPLESRFDGDRVHIASADGVLHIVDFGDETAAAAIHALPAAGDHFDSFVSTNHLIQLGSDELQILSLAAADAPSVALDFPLGGFANRMAGAGGLAFVHVDDAIRAYDLSAPATPVLLASIEDDQWIEDLALHGSLLAARESAGGPIRLYDVSNPSAPIALAPTGDGTTAYVRQSMAFSDDHFYVVGSVDGGPAVVSTFDVSNPDAVVWVDQYGFPNWEVTAVAGSGNRYAIGTGFGVEVFEWTGGPYATRTGTFVLGRVEVLRVTESFVFAGTSGGVHIIELAPEPHLVGSIGTGNTTSISVGPDHVYATDTGALRTLLGPCVNATDVPEFVSAGQLSLRAYPNPSGSGVSIALALPTDATVTLRVWDVAGRNVRTLANADHRQAGPQLLAWDRRDARGRLVPQGIYWVGGDVSGRRVEPRQLVVR